MPYRLALEATIQAESETEAIRLMAAKLLKVADEHPAPPGSHRNIGGFGYPMSWKAEVVLVGEEE